MKHTYTLFYVAMKELLTLRMLIAFAVLFGVYLELQFLISVLWPLLEKRWNPDAVLKFHSKAESVLPIMVPLLLVPHFKNHVYRRQLLTGLNRYDIYTKIWLQGVLIWLAYVLFSYLQLLGFLAVFKQPVNEVGAAFLREIQYKLPMFGFGFLLMLTVTFLLRSYLSILVFLFYPLLEYGLDFAGQKLLKTKLIGDYVPYFQIQSYSEYKIIFTYEQLIVFTLLFAGLMLLNIYSFFKQEL